MSFLTSVTIPGGSPSPSPTPTSPVLSPYQPKGAFLSGVKAPTTFASAHATRVSGADGAAQVAQANSDHENSFGGMTKNFLTGLWPASGIPQQWQSGQEQVDEPFIDKGNAPGGKLNPVQAAEGALKVGSGLITKLTAPIAPLMKPIGAGINAAGNALANTPYMRAYGKDVASTPAEQNNAPERILGAISNASNIGMAVAGGLEGTREAFKPRVKGGFLESAKVPVTSDLSERTIPVRTPPRLRIEAPAQRELLQNESPKLLSSPKPGTKGEGFSMSDKPDVQKVKIGKAINDYQTALDKYSKSPSPTKLAAVLKARSAMQSAKAILSNPESPAPTERLAQAHAEYTRSQGYEPYTPNTELPKEMDTSRVAPIERPVVRAQAETSPVSESEKVGAAQSSESPSSSIIKPVEGEGAYHEAGSAVKAVASMTKDNLIGQVKDLPGFNAENWEHQSNWTADAVTHDRQGTLDMLSGDKPLPHGMLGSAFVTAAKNLAKLSGDGELAAAVARSPLHLQVSRGAQEMGFLGAHADEIDPVRAIQDIDRVRAPRSTPRDVRAVRDETRTAARSGAREAVTNKWQDFVKDITCNY